MNTKGKSAKQLISEIDHFVDTAIVCVSCEVINQYTVKTRGSTQYAYCDKCGSLVGLIDNEKTTE